LKGSLKDVRKSVKWGFHVVSLWIHTLFIGWRFGWFKKHSTFCVWFAHTQILGWCEFHKGESGRRRMLLSGVQIITLTYLVIEHVTTNTISSKTKSHLEGG
jgi:hypothetical protein